MKKVLIISLALMLSLSVAEVASAQSTTGLKMQQLHQQQAATGKSMLQDNKASSSADKQNRANIMNVALTAINGTTLSVIKNAKTYTVTVDATTILKRRFGGPSTLTEFSVGNTLDVRGTYTDGTKTAVAATFIKNRSIMKRRGTFIGDVVSKDGNTIVIRSVHRGNQSITVDPTTKYVNRKQLSISLTDVVVGHRIRVKGMWDKSSNTITEVSQLKDFTLPLKASGSATISASPSATVTP